MVCGFSSRYDPHRGERGVAVGVATYLLDIEEHERGDKDDKW